ncbi:MAG TPA: divalent-cation tolerance protein CutA [Bryobacteraceae bacterium]|jgi:periplasmic divalent cation tolerance protein|nr:divalent-cation tolerance protein CutA [Bryobacteraceae bacterium]
MTNKIVVFSTCGSEIEAERLARLLVEERLAACVNIVAPVRSFYRWKGVVENANEWMLIIKTSRDLFERLRLSLESAHSYELPEVLAVPVIEGSPNYMSWLQSELETRPDA